MRPLRSPGGAIRAGDYKLIEFFEDGRKELYNLKSDIGEKQDLAAKMPTPNKPQKASPRKNRGDGEDE